MIIKFRINFKTQPGEQVYITGSSLILGNYDPDRAFRLTRSESDEWNGEIMCDPVKERLLYYKYFVKSSEGTIYFEAGGGRRLALNSATAKIESRDQWQGNTTEAPFLTDPFSHVFFGNECSPYTQTHKRNYELIIRVVIPNVPKDCSIYVCGSSKEMGEWKPEKAANMARLKGLKWIASFPIEKEQGKTWEYKFIRKNDITGEYTWEDGLNRVLEIPQVSKHETLIVEHSSANFKTGKPKFAGCVAPLFALRSKNGCGIGEIEDIKLMVDWAKHVGMSIIQMLPINDTSEYMNWKDSYPYNCISSIALHPIYLSASGMGHVKDREKAKAFAEEAKALNHNATVDYDDVLEFKMRYFRAIYDQSKEDTFVQPEYYKFTKANKDWLYPYAVFCALRDKNKTANFRKWKKYSVFSQADVDKLSSGKNEIKDDIFFYVYLQYHLHNQMTEAIDYAHANGIALKGDLPIGISRNSADAWQHPQYFNFGQQAGAPPDYYSAQGQNWGFPTYNWEEMARDNYKWWKKRMRKMSDYFDAYRIDHILGFFRIWEVPYPLDGGKAGHFSPVLPLDIEEIESYGLNPPKEQKEENLQKIAEENLFMEDPYHKCKWVPCICAKESKEYKTLKPAQKKSFDALFDNFFYKRNNDLWYRNAMRKLQQIIAASNMLTCGEDLGMLAEPVHKCMADLKILSLELQIMPKQQGVNFGDPVTFPYLSVCSTSTHDSATLRMWLGERLKTVSYKSEDTGETYYDATPAECENVLKNNLASPSMFAIFPLQDWMSVNDKIRNRFAYSERINNPAVPHWMWKYRMHITIEQLLEATALNNQISKLIKESKR
jgi:4-alpha-glucanotransferase